MVTLLDVNILIALCDQLHASHLAAALWFAKNAQDGWASCPLTQNGVVRIMSSPGYPNRRPFAQIVAQLRPMLAAPEHHFWTDDISIVDSSKFVHAGIVGHRQITDVYLLALAVLRGGRLLTNDGGIATNLVAGAKKANLLALRR